MQDEWKVNFTFATSKSLFLYEEFKFVEFVFRPEICETQKLRGSKIKAEAESMSILHADWRNGWTTNQKGATFDELVWVQAADGLAWQQSFITVVRQQTQDNDDVS